MLKEQILESLKRVTGEKNIHLEITENELFGDYSTNIALQGKGNPREKAEEIINKLKGDKDLMKVVEKLEVAGPGFINFWIKKEVLFDILLNISSQNDIFGKSDVGSGKTVVVDYSSPNIAKRFSIGHLRSTIIGQALYNLYKELGYKVIGDNHLGDWGTQFGKLLYMIDLYKLETFDVDKLEDLYIEFHKNAEEDPSLDEKGRAWFKLLEDGDEKARSIWKKCLDTSMEEFNRIYDFLGVDIDFTYGESVYGEEMKKMIEEFKEGKLKGLKEGEDGAKILDLKEYGVKIPLMILKSDGATTYATRDLACIRFRVEKWDPDIIIYEVGKEQTLHFEQVFAAAKKLGFIKKSAILYHTKHGLYLSPNGKKYKTREGGTIRLEEVLDEAIKRAKKLGCEDEITAKTVGVGAIKYFDLMHDVTSDIIFDWEKVMNMEGNSGPYLQYTVARANSVLSKVSKINGNGGLKDFEPEKEEMLLLRSLIHYREIVMDAAYLYSPNILCEYLYSLAQMYNSFYNKYRILESENEEPRVLLTKGTGQVLKNGLKILGIDTPEKM